MSDLLTYGPAIGTASGARGRTGRGRAALRAVLRKLTQLLLLLLGVSTLLFMLLRLAGNPAAILGGRNATPADLAAIEREYGLGGSLWTQYWRFLSQAVRLNFGHSLFTGQEALGMVLTALPYTVTLALAALVTEMLVAVPLGVWLGTRPGAAPRRAAAGVIFVAQGVPGYLVGLLLIELFAVKLHWLPSIGEAGGTSWIMPTLTLAAYITPRLVRVLAASVSEAMAQDYVRVARAGGASPRAIAFRQALPNALVGATALLGAQFAQLMSGALITEVIFAWPGIGLLMINSVQTLDFPVVQALVFVVAVLVFLVNSAVDLLVLAIDPRIKRGDAR